MIKPQWPWKKRECERSSGSWFLSMSAEEWKCNEFWEGGVESFTRLSLFTWCKSRKGIALLTTKHLHLLVLDYWCPALSYIFIIKNSLELVAYLYSLQHYSQ